VKWIEIPIPAVAAALAQRRIDAGLSTEPFMTRDAQVQPLIDVAAKYKPIPQAFDAHQLFWSARA
jgi:hypothetical protein